jgi:hypothetical protein
MQHKANNFYDYKRYSYGRRDTPTDLLIDEKELRKSGIDVIHVGRGGNSMSFPFLHYSFPFLYPL